MKNQLFISQLIGDLLFPILGYFFWNWSIYFILLFVLIDLLSALVVAFIKARKIAKFQGDTSRYVHYGVFSVLLFLITVFSVHAMIFVHQPAISFTKEFISFLSYSDMGIAQGYLLLPFFILMAYQQYQMEFAMPALYRKISLKELWNDHLRSYLWLLAFAGMSLGFVLFLQVNDLVLFTLLLIVLLLRAFGAFPIINVLKK